MMIREPAVAGSFYPADETACRKALEACFAARVPAPTVSGRIIAGIVRPGEDKITHRFGLNWAFFHKPFVAAGWGHVFDATFDYISDHRYKAAQVGMTVQYTPNIPKAAIGMYRRLGKGDVFFRWRPYLAFDYRNVQDDAGNATLAMLGDYSNLTLRAQVELLVMKQFRLTLAGAYIQELMNAKSPHGSVDVAGRYSFDPKDRFSMVVGYTYGQAAPEFKRQNKFSLAFGLKY